MARRKIGEIGVDAGLCWIGDPCYILHKKTPPKAIGKDWGDFCGKLHKRHAIHEERPNTWQFTYDAGHSGLGVVTQTGHGDGVYPVYAEFDEHGCVMSVTVEFIGPDEDEYEEDH